MHQIAIFASGRGSNAEKILAHFEGHPSIKIKLIVSNKKDAAVLDLADRYDIGKLHISRKSFYDGAEILTHFKSLDINFIVLAGFLWLIPDYMVQAFPNKIINIHPALLPKYGGKGMYGHHVHKAVYDHKEKESGISIHYVNEQYDEGNIIFQARCQLRETDQVNDIAKKVLALEHYHFPRTIETLLADNP